MPNTGYQGCGPQKQSRPVEPATDLADRVAPTNRSELTELAKLARRSDRCLLFLNVAQRFELLGGGRVETFELALLRGLVSA